MLDRIQKDVVAFNLYYYTPQLCCELGQTIGRATLRNTKS